MKNRRSQCGRYFFAKTAKMLRFLYQHDPQNYEHDAEEHHPVFRREHERKNRDDAQREQLQNYMLYVKKLFKL